MPLLTCPDCGGLLPIITDSMRVVMYEDRPWRLSADLGPHSCDPEKAYVMAELESEDA